MKLRMIVVLCLAMSVLFCACGTEIEQDEDLRSNDGKQLEETIQTEPEETTQPADPTGETGTGDETGTGNETGNDLTQADPTPTPTPEPEPTPEPTPEPEPTPTPTPTPTPIPEPEPEPEPEPKPTPTPTPTPTPEPEPEPTPTPTPTPEPEPEPENVFFNDNNNILEAGQVTIRPRHVYWEGDVLVAQCFVINGINKPVYNINVKALRFANASGTIADAQFGVLNSLVLNPNTHALWTFKFSRDVIAQLDGDLASLICQSSVSYNY